MVKIAAFTSVNEIAADDWDCLANPSDKPYNPFVSHAFFKALEASRSAVAETGWLGQHLVIKDDEGRAIGLAPCFLKSHSYGEYVFDHGWADAYRRAGGRYYPKLQVAVPFTPVTGPRLFAPDAKTRAVLAQALISLCQTRKASSVHITFVPEDECEPVASGPWLKRTDLQFHWHNNGYGSFHDFLASLSSRKRKNIRKERASVANAGIEIEWLTGNSLLESHWDAFFSFYMDTGSRKWGSPYLTRAFFSLIGESMKDRVLLVMAKRRKRYIAGALNFIGSDALYGRNWGAIEHHENLHFEACYYQAIDFAIANKLARVEAGAQGPHKLARGYLPKTTYSLHYLADRRLAQAVEDYLSYERAETRENGVALAAHSPFRHDERDHGI
jgi:hypothetical protein